MAKRQAPQVRAYAVADAIRADILAGKLEPGSRLTFPDLCAQHAVSVGVLREALVRLLYQGIVQTETNLGFKVLELSREGFAEHVMLRTFVEPQFVRYAVVQGNVEWESDLVAAHHVLERAPMFEDSQSSPSTTWDAAHARFHIALVAACQSPRVTEITQRIHDEAAIYRRWSVSRDPADVWAGRTADEHRGLLDAVLGRDPDCAMRRVEQHIERSAAAITFLDELGLPAATPGRATARI